eukprot:2541807-Prymnesium_polylepis.1
MMVAACDHHTHFRMMVTDHDHHGNSCALPSTVCRKDHYSVMCNHRYTSKQGDMASRKHKGVPGASRAERKYPGRISICRLMHQSTPS